MGNGLGVRQLSVKFKGKTTTVELDPFEDSWDQISYYMATTYGAISMEDSQYFAKQLGRILYRLQVFDKTTAWEFVESPGETLRALGRAINHKHIKAKEKELRRQLHHLNKKNNPPTWNRADQYKPNMKGKSRGKGWR